MHTVIGKNGKIRLPGALLKEMGLQEGDLFEAVRMNQTIVLMPLVACPAGLLADLKEEIGRIKEAVRNETAPDFTVLEELLQTGKGQ